MGAGTVAAITPRILIAECCRLGVSRELLLEAVGLAPDWVPQASHRIALEKMYGLWDAILRLTKNPMFAVHAAENVPFGAYRVLDYMLAASSSPKDALMRTGRSFGLVNNAFLLTLRLRRDLAYLELHNPNDPNGLPRAYVEYILIIYLVRLRSVTQVDCKPVEVRVNYGTPALAGEYDRVFGTKVRFRQKVNRLVFPRHLMEIRHPHADPELCELLEDYAQRKLRNTACSSPAFKEIQRALAYNLEAGNVTLTLLSRQLAKSRRSLQREIHANGMTFRELLDNARLSRALILLKEPDLPITEVATRLNFADPSSFCRAFRRWIGQSPLQYRNRLSWPGIT